MTIHVVKRGDSVYSIARQYGADPVILAQNNEVGEDRLVPGQTLVVLTPRTVHTVQPGETLYAIAGRYGVSVNQLWRNNIWLRGGNLIRAGRRLVISYAETPTIRLSVLGYAYPHVQYAVLRQILPYANILAPFSYGFQPDGSLEDLNDLPLIALARDYGVAPYMHLSNLTQEGFSGDLASAILNDRQAQEQLIHNALLVMRRKGYQGLDVDFEYVPAEDALAYAGFLQRLRDRLAPSGMTLLAALAAQEYAGQSSVLIDGHDYRAIGLACDKVLLMTYEWGYAYGPPMAIAPLPNVRRVADYTISQMSPEQVYLGIPNYGYDWPLPFAQGETRARSLGHQEAIAIAARHGAEIEYDQTAQSPYFYYTALDGVRHVVWFEDARSVKAKLELIGSFSFYGAGYWNFMRTFPQNWLVVNAMCTLIR